MTSTSSRLSSASSTAASPRRGVPPKEGCPEPHPAPPPGFLPTSTKVIFPTGEQGGVRRTSVRRTRANCTRMQTAQLTRRGRPTRAGDGFCPVCGWRVPYDARRGSTFRSRPDLAARACGKRCELALHVIVALRELERHDSAGIRRRVLATLAGEEPLELSDLLLARWRRGQWRPSPEDVQRGVPRAERRSRTQMVRARRRPPPHTRGTAPGTAPGEQRRRPRHT